MHLFDFPTIANWIAQYGYGVILVAVALESAGVPAPGEATLVSAAAYAGATGRLDIGLVVLAAASGAILGDNIGYWVGRRAGAPLLARYGAAVGLDARRQKLGQYLFLEHGGKIVFFGRFVALLRAFAALLAGVNGLSPGRFFLFNAAGAIAWASLFGVSAYYLGARAREISGPLGWALLALGAGAGIFLWRLYRRNEERFLARAEQAMQADGGREPQGHTRDVRRGD